MWFVYHAPIHLLPKNIYIPGIKSSPQGRRIRRVFPKKSSHLQMARARQKLLKFTFQDFGIDGLMKSRLRWLVGFFRMDGKTIEHISLLGHSSGGCRGGGAFCSYISGSGPFEKALQNRYSHSQKPRWNHLSPVVAAKNGAWVDKYIRNIISSMKRWPSVTVPWWSNRNPIIQQFQKHPKTGELPGWPHCWWFRNPQMFHLLSMFHPACKKWGICSISYWSVTGAARASLPNQRPQAFGLLPFSRPEGLDRAHIAKFDFLAEPARYRGLFVKNPWIFTEG